MARADGNIDETARTEGERPPPPDEKKPQGTASVNERRTNADNADLKAERDALLDRMARNQAEFENARRRAAKQQQDFREFARADTIRSLLPILDSFDRALQAPAQNLEEFRSGVDLIRRQLHDALSKLGVRPIPSQDEPFDPRVHEAIETVESPTAKDNHVVQELQRGYTLNDRLLRPASVIVARSPEPVRPK
ncbi:MAG TPA: nucleotide exchange factor GrpE [Terriglobales bacterium]|nr:nucleotide exchange factor GrpE [Terriglobales bacterium]